jgi:hypothetical protein
MKSRRKSPAAGSDPGTLRQQKKGKANSGRYRSGSTTITAQSMQVFLETLAEGWSPTRAAETAKVPRRNFVRLRESNEVFAAAWDAAVEAGTDQLEDEAKRRGLTGWDEPLVYQGERTGQTVRKHSDMLLMFMLNGRRPEKFRQNVKIDANVDVAAGFRTAMAKATGGKK